MFLLHDCAKFFVPFSFIICFDREISHCIVRLRFKITVTWGTEHVEGGRINRPQIFRRNNNPLLIKLHKRSAFFYLCNLCTVWLNVFEKASVVELCVRWKPQMHDGNFCAKPTQHPPATDIFEIAVYKRAFAFRPQLYPQLHFFLCNSLSDKQNRTALRQTTNIFSYPKEFLFSKMIS